MATKKIQITAPVAAKFLLPYNIGQVVELEEKQADELIAGNCARTLEDKKNADKTADPKPKKTNKK